MLKQMLQTHALISFTSLHNPYTTPQWSWQTQNHSKFIEHLLDKISMVSRVAGGQQSMDPRVIITVCAWVHALSLVEERNITDLKWLLLFFLSISVVSVIVTCKQKQNQTNTINFFFLHRSASIFSFSSHTVTGITTTSRRGSGWRCRVEWPSVRIKIEEESRLAALGDGGCVLKDVVVVWRRWHCCEGLLLLTDQPCEGGRQLFSSDITEVFFYWGVFFILTKNMYFLKAAQSK